MTELPVEPRLFRVSNVGGRWHIDEVHCFGRASLVSDRVLLLDAFNQLHTWHGRAARIADIEVAPKLARLYLRSAASDGRPAELRQVSDEYTPHVAEEGREVAEFTCHFGDRHAAVSASFSDPYEAHLADVGRTEMFGRAVDKVFFDTGSTHTESPCASLGVSESFLAEVAGTAAPPPVASEHEQLPLPTQGLTLVTTTLHVDARKQYR